ncbi:uncharacterized protein LOC143569713 [Bidens hawaiensis]|uniref:uncharacterized protein LOC143569713 n=1 Tax=Bidens hawaiensis TaxID=980011 RepID=UPI00404AF32A
MMIRNLNPSFPLIARKKKRKWKTTVSFLLRKRNRTNCNHLHNLADGDCFCCSGLDVNPTNDDDDDDVDRDFKGFGTENPRLGLDDVGEELVEYEEEEEEEEVDESSKAASIVAASEPKKNKDGPPDDDCCPICFDTFTIACQTNCAHWFCANCILRFWTYRTVLQKCNCPICARPISKLTPEASLLIMHEAEVVEVLKNVQRYNRLFQGGIKGAIRKVFEVPNLFKRMLCGLMDPDRFRGNYYAMRSFALLMSCIYNIGSFDFIPTGSLGVRRLFDLCAVALVVILCLVGIGHRLVLRQLVRRLAANQL